MMFGNVKDLDSTFFWLPQPLKAAVTHLQQTDFNALPAGKYELQGSDMFVQVMDLTTKPLAETRPEVHRDYIDVQFLVRGREKIGVVPDSGKNVVVEDSLAERDILFYQSVENEVMLMMTPGCFAVFQPHDVHRPACAVEQPEAIRKVIVKVSVALLARGGA